MGDLSAHFSLGEFLRASDPTSKRPPDELVWRLEALRVDIGAPLRIVSWYRTWRHELRLTGLRRSRHPMGDAVDVPAGVVTLGAAVRAGFRGIGVRGGWVVHLDCRPARRPVIFYDKPV